MKKIILSILVLTLAVLVVLINAPKSAKVSTTDKPTIKIGAILPLSGDLAIFGQSIKKGIEFAIEDVNKIPDNKFVYEAVFEDNQNQTKLAAMTANKLIFQDRVSVLMTSTSGSGKVVAPLTVQNKIIGLSGAHANEVIDGIYNFGITPSSPAAERSITEFINSHSPKKIALVSMQTPSIIEIIENLKNNLLLSREMEFKEFNLHPSERDFKMLVYKMNKWKPDLIFVAADAPVLDIFIHEMQRQKIEGIKLGLQLTNRTENFLSFEGFYGLELSSGTPDFVTRFSSSTAYTSPYYYDAIMIFRNAVENAAQVDNRDNKIPSVEAISAQIHKLSSYEGVAAKYKILENGRFESPLRLYKIESGKVIEVEE